MLHILWMLLKIILIILGILLGLAVLLILLVLFCPVRYCAEGAKKPGDIRNMAARVRVSWLFGGISLRLFFKDGRSSSDFRIFGIPVLRLRRRQKRKSAARSEAEKAAGPSGSSDGLPEPEQNSPEDHTEKELPETEALSEDIPDFEDEREHREKSENVIRTNDSASGIFQKIRNRLASFWRLLKEILSGLQKIPESVTKISLTIQRVYDKIDWWKQFLEHPRVKEGLAHTKKELFRLIHHIFPRKIEGQMTIGSEDPSVTGAVLALLGITMPFHKNQVRIVPVFENRNFLEGRIRMRGRVYGIIPAVVLLRLYFDKNIKYIISRWKNKED